MNVRHTLEATLDEGTRVDTPPMPGAVLIFGRGAATCEVLPVPPEGLVLGRENGAGAVFDDPRMSRSHAEIRFDGARFTVRDLGSRNGTFAEGERLAPETPCHDPRWLRLGDSILLLERDARPHQVSGVNIGDGTVMGATLMAAWKQIGRVAHSGNTLFIHGESGSGKELAARAFHALGPRPRGPFVAVNCSAIPHSMAERLLFGTKRGAYSGAVADASGYAQAAHGGTLFLDEVADLDLAVQAKLLRMLESREVIPLGATRPDTVELSVCCATHKDLRAEVAAGRFRKDLYFRIGRPVVRLPPLRERPEEIPWLIEQAMRGESDASLGIHASLVETCLSRPWPGNVRELITEVRAAVHQALAEPARCVHARHLDADAGAAMTSAPENEDDAPEPNAPVSRLDRAALERTLRAHEGNVSAAARSLFMHRTQLRRMLHRHGLDPRMFARSGA